METNKIENPGRKICGAIVPPNALNRLPGYFLLLKIEIVNGKYYLIFLAEGEEADPGLLITKLIKKLQKKKLICFLSVTQSPTGSEKCRGTMKRPAA